MLLLPIVKFWSRVLHAAYGCARGVSGVIVEFNILTEGTKLIIEILKFLYYL